MLSTSNKQVVRNLMQALEARDLDRVVTYFHPDCRFHGWAPETLDVQGYHGAMSALLDAFPDSHFPIYDLIAEDDRVAMRHEFRGTHKHEYMGVTATGNSVVCPATGTFHFSEGKVSEIWLNADFLSLLQQIGAIPAFA